MFREVLIESVPGRVRGTGVGFPLSVAVHGLVVATAIVLSARGVEEPPEPAMPVIFQNSAPPPSGPSGLTARAAVPARRVEERPATVFRSAALPVAASLPVPAAPPRDSSERFGTSLDYDGEGSGAGGGANGLGDGTGSDPSGIGTGEREAAIPVGGDVRPPRLIDRVEPVYPDAARTMRAQGLVILEAVITAGGQVEEVRVLKSPNPLLTASAVAAVERWRYQTATLNRRPVKVFLTVTVEFKLH